MAIAALAHCSKTTEIIVVVDTDLAVGAEVDEITVTVEDGAGFVEKRSARVGPGATALPLTLGVTAGDDPNRTVTVKAVGRLRGADVTAASIRTTFVEGESKLAHVSLCRSCGASCATVDATGSSLPAWNGSTPRGPLCAAGPVDASADAGDGSTGVDSGNAGDSGEAGALDLLAFWDFEDDGGSEVFDKSGNGRHAVVGGNGVSRGLGRDGGGLVFVRLDGGEDGTFSCQDHVASLIENEGTLSFWWRNDDDTPPELARSAAIFDNQNSTRDHFFVYRWKEDQPTQFTLAFQLDSGVVGNDDFVNGDGGTKFPMPLNAWTRVVITWSVLAATLTVAQGDAQALEFYKAWTPRDPRCVFGIHTRGALDDVRFYGRVLSAAEIATIP